MKTKTIFFLKYYFPVLLWAGVIFFFSSVPSLQIGVGSTSEEVVLRKLAHFGEFVILAFLLWRLFYSGYKFQARYAFWWALAFSSLYAASDEFHQTLVSGRTGKMIDVFYDSASALFALEFLVVFSRKKMTWKNAVVVLASIFLLVGLELKMLSETESFRVSFPKMRMKLGYMIKHELEFIKKRAYVKKSVSSETGPPPKEETAKVAEALLRETPPTLEISEPDVPAESWDVPDKISVDVPFTSQAPLGIWDAVHEETCEEASVVMLEYYSKEKTLTPEIAEKELQALVAYENKNLGDYKDTDAAQTAQLAKDFYGLDNLKVVYDFSADDLKKYLAKGKPIIIPAAGRLLGNPYYTPPGPPYHNLVLVGYDGDKIITNDPGTRRGEGYVYDLDTLYGAIHDFTGDVKDIEQGRKAMIIME